MANPMPMDAFPNATAAKSAAAPPHHGRGAQLRPWSDDDRDALQALHAERLSCTEIANRLNRSVEAVSNMSRRLGLRRRDTALPWTQQDLFVLERMLDEGRSLRQIAESTGHPRSSVADKLRQLSITSQRFRKPWANTERETVLALHATGASLAAIAEALPGRSVDAIQQKLQELVGPAPFRVARRRHQTTILPPTSPEPPPPAPRPLVRLMREQRPPQPAVIAASTDEMIRWLRSRDFMVLHRPSGWQVDRHALDDEAALLDFVNARRLRLSLPPFASRGGHAAEPADGATTEHLAAVTAPQDRARRGDGPSPRSPCRPRSRW